MAKHLNHPSLIRYIVWRTRPRRPIWLELKSHLQVQVRPGVMDRYTLSEVFFNEEYGILNTPPQHEVKTIVDVGANVGYSLLYLLHHAPNAHVTAFEPHPTHISQINLHLKRNGLENRVALSAAAAGTEDGTLFLTDKGAISRLVHRGGHGSIAVRVVDWFANLPAGTIDFLKMDIEGSEYPLLRDSRFEEVARRTHLMAIEWHTTEEFPERQGREWCIRRLTELGFSVQQSNIAYVRAGMLWATRCDAGLKEEKR